MSVLKRWEWARSCEVAFLNVVIEGPKELLERVREALVVSAGEVGVAPYRGLHQGRVADQDFIGTISMSQKQLVGMLAVPGQRAF
jgi:hypothetical protein